MVNEVRQGARRHIRCPISCLTLIVALALASCSLAGSDETTPTGSPVVPKATSSATAAASATISPTALPVATESRSATAEPRPPATPQLPTQVTPTPQPTQLVDERPQTQVVDVPDVDAHYSLDIQSIDLESGQITVKQTIDIESNQGVIEQFYLSVATARYGYFTLDRLAVNQQTVTPQVLNEGYTLLVPVPDGDEWLLEIDFRLNLAQVPSDWFGSGRDGGIIRLGNWFPIISNDHAYPSTADPAYTRSASFDVWLPLPAGVLFGATGEVVNTETLENGQVRHHIRAEQVRDFALAISTDFQLDSIQSGRGVTVELYSPQTTNPEVRQRALQAAAFTIDRLSELIGPYPYQTFRIADSGPSLPGGLEFPMITFVNLDVGGLEPLVIHETAHQWLYGIIGTRPQADPWIDEGGAKFLEGGLSNGFDSVPDPPAGGYGYPLDSSDYELPGGPGIPGHTAIYLQGQAFYLTVLQEMGADSFWAAMRQLYEDHLYGVVTPWDMLLNWQMHSSVDLRPIFRDTFRYDWIDQLPEPRQGRYFGQTNHWISHGFLRYWEQNGGLPTFGYPITEEFSSTDGIVTQYFERARFEWHPGSWPERFDVLLGRLGVELTAGRRSEPAFQRIEAGNDQNCTFFEETGHRLCFGFRSYWERNGGLAIYGFPISEEFEEDGRIVQHFERQRLEYHPENAPPWDILGGLLGRQVLEHTGPS